MIVKQALSRIPSVGGGKHKTFQNTYSENVLYQECCPNFQYKPVEVILHFIISINTDFSLFK